MIYEKLTPKGKEEIKEAVLLTLTAGYDDYGHNLQSEVYNNNYVFLNEAAASKWLIDNLGALNTMKIISENNEINKLADSSMSAAEQVCNYVIDTAGKELLAESRALKIAWNRKLTYEDRKAIFLELESYEV